jgi:hypothetical protein
MSFDDTSLHRVSDHAILASVVVTASVKLRRKMDRGDAKRTRVYVLPLTMDAVGSKGLHELPGEMARLGGDIVAKVQSWEGGPRTPGRPITDPLDTLTQQQAAASITPIKQAILDAGKGVAP